MIAPHRIAAEVHDIIRHCARGPYHLRALNDRYSQLKSDPKWDQTDADKVYATALRIITGVRP